MAAFEEMGVLPEIGKAVEEMDWLLPTDVQAEAIPLILGGGDVLMAAETGSGKTGAFCLPIIQIVAETLKEIQSGKSQGKAKAPAISPTWILSVWDRDAAMAITPDGLRCQSREQKEWHGCRANKGVYSEKKPPQPENINHNSTYPTWFTKELKLLIMEKKKAHANYKHCGLQVDYKKFSSLRAQCCFLRDQVYKSYIGKVNVDSIV